MSFTKSKWFETYKGPIVGGLVAAIVLILWVIDVINGIRHEARDPLRRYALGLSTSIESMLLVGDRVTINRNLMGNHFTQVVRQTPHLLFIYLMQNDEILCSAGNLPNDTHIDRSFGERIEGDALILWKRVGDYFEPPQDAPLVRGGGESRGWISPSGNGPPPPGRGFNMGPPIRRPFGPHPYGPPGGNNLPGGQFMSGPMMNNGEGANRPPGPMGPEEFRPYRWGPEKKPQKLQDGSLMLVMGLSLRHGRYITGGRRRNSVFLFAIFAILSIGILYAWSQSIASSIVSAELEKERTEREHLEELGLTAAGLAHETKNPIGIMLGLAQRIARHPDDAEEVRGMAEQIQDAADRASGRLGEFLKYSRLREPIIELHNGDKLVREIAMALSPDFEATGIKLEIDIESMAFKCDKDMFTQVLVNLLINSLHACKEGDRVSISLKQTDGFGELTVSDDGCGISTDLIDDVFKPYVTGKQNGHGLGLAVTRRIVELHEWTIQLASAEGKGTEITLGNIEVTPIKEA